MNMDPKMPKNRCKFIIILIGFLLITNSHLFSNCNIKGIAHLDDGSAIDSLHVGIYSHWTPQNRLLECFEYITVKDSVFSIDIEYGKYTLAVYANGYEPYRTHLLLTKENPKVTVDMNLPPLSVPSKLDSVKIFGDFCDWEKEKAVHLEKESGIWFLKDPALIPTGSVYNFLINREIETKNLAESQARNNTFRATYSSVHSGKKIVFDPSLYCRPYKKASATVTGSERHEEFNNLLVDLDTVYSTFEKNGFHRHAPLKKSKAEINRLFKEFCHDFDVLEAKYDPFFSPFIHEKRCLRVIHAHPVWQEVKKLYKNGVTHKKRVQLANSALAEDYLQLTLNLLEKIDPNSMIIESPFSSLIINVIWILNLSPELCIKYNTSEKALFEFAENFIKTTCNKKACANQLFNLGKYYANDEKRKKISRKYINWLIKDYPDSRYVQSGQADRILNNLKLIIGDRAPHFSVKNIKDDSLSLQDLYGKFVFIDFWGTWCKGCQLEIPPIQKMRKKLPKEELEIIGLIAKDKLFTVKKYVKKHKIGYHNALVSDSVINSYGVIRFPTTFLIAPNGEIIAKDLKGKKLYKTVKQKMKEWKSKTL